MHRDMPRPNRALTARTVESTKRPGLHHDGNGLYLQVSPSGGKTWIYRFQFNGRRRDMGLGPARLCTLAEARDKAYQAGRTMRDGKDPIEERELLRKKQPTGINFQDAASAFIEAKSPGWKNKKHCQQWSNTIKKYCNPVIGTIAVDKIDTQLVLSCLKPIWLEKPETASRVRGRVEAILDWAKVSGYREGENPASWKGHLDQLLPSKSKLAGKKGFASMPYDILPAFMRGLSAHNCNASLALEFLILTGCRTSEVLLATWQEIDLGGKQWIIPADRMKAGKEHRVPLSTPALRVLARMKELCGVNYIFPGQRGSRPLSNMAMLEIMRRQGIPYTVHGFRATFRTWVAEQTMASPEIAEAALAHSPPSRVIAAYQRGDLFEKRYQLMEHWGEYVYGAETKDGPGAPHNTPPSQAQQLTSPGR
jgi:integrase